MSHAKHTKLNVVSLKLYIDCIYMYSVPESRHVHEVVKLSRLLSIVGMGHRKLVTSTGVARLVHIQIYVLHTINLEGERERERE